METKEVNNDSTNNKTNQLKDGLRIVFSRLEEHKKKLSLFSLLGLVSTLGSSALPYLTGKVFDSILATDAIGIAFGISLTLTGIILVYGVIQLMVNIIDWQLTLQMDTLGTRVDGSFLVDALRKLYKLPLSFHHEKKVGNVISKIHRARRGYKTIISQAPQIIPPVASLLVAFAFTFFINTTLSLVMLSGVVVYSIFFAFNVKPLAKLQEKSREAWTDMFGDAWDAVRNPRVVKLLQMEEKEAQNVNDDFMNKALPTWFDIFSQWQKLSFGQRMVVLLTQVLILLLGAPMVQQGVLSIGDLIAFNAYAGLVFGPFVRLGRQWQTIQNGLVEISKTDEMLNTPPENYGSGREIVDARKDIQFRNVSFSYSKEEGNVLKNINFTARAGETVAIVGRSGEGKSTLVDMIPRFIQPTSGQILLGNEDINDIDLVSLRSRIALVPQRINLFNKTIRENIRYGFMEASEGEIKKAAEKAQALEFIKKSHAGFDSKVGEKGLKLSAGQSQRIAIARAFLADPDILILDEPTSALDAQNEARVVEVLEDLMENRTTFIIAHRLSTVRSVDKILVIENGAIVESGSHEELIAQEGDYKRLYDMQIGLH